MWRASVIAMEIHRRDLQPDWNKKSLQVLRIVFYFSTRELKSFGILPSF
jgi:hypothetical protein